MVFQPDIFTWIFVPSFIHISAILSTYVLVSLLFSKKGALISGFLIALLPTNVTMGGPVFLIPVNLSLIFIPICLLCAFQFFKIKKEYHYLFMFFIFTFLLYAHPPSAMVLLFFLGFYSLLLLVSRENSERKHAFYLMITIGVSLFAALPNYLGELQNQGISSISFQFWVYLQEIPFLFGFIQSIFFIVGFYVLSKTNDKKIWSFLLTILFLLINIVLFTQLNINYLVPYQRIFVPLFLFMTIIASYGFTRIINIRSNHKNIFVLILLLILSTVVFETSTQQNSYYEVIDETDYENFIMIRNISSPQDVIICDPWKARALPAIAKRTVYAVIPFGPTEKYINLVNNATRFLENDCRNTSFLLENNITFVYSRGYNCFNHDLKLLKTDIYQLITVDE
jgi:hypothetical protein